MRLIPEDYKIRALLFDKFGGPQTNDSLNWSENILYDETGTRVKAYQFPEIQEAVVKEYEFLCSLSEPKISKKYNLLRKKQQKQHEDNAWINQPETLPVFSKWFVMPYWSIEEAVLLINNRDPLALELNELFDDFPSFQIVIQMKHHLEVAKRSTEVGELDKARIIPTKFIEWATAKGFEVPLEMVEYGKSEKAKKPKIKETKTPAKHNCNELNPKERESLLKLVIGMATEQYGYQPNVARNEATANIATDLETNGIPLDRDTILKWLREGAKLLPNEPK